MLLLLERPAQMLSRSVFVTLSLLVTQNAFAELRLAEIFSDEMVLQRDKDVPVWGWSDPGDSVRVDFDGQTAPATADSNGRWMAKLAPMNANATGQTLTVKIAGGKSQTFANVLVGEVWLAAGQSNMVAGGPDLPTGVYPPYQSPDDATAPMRFRTFGFGTDQTPIEDFPAVYRDNKREDWQALEFDDNSSIPQYFTRVLRDNLEVPIGMIRVAFPGTNQTAWLAQETLEKFEGEGGNYFLEYKEYKDSGLAQKPKSTKDGETISTFDEFWEYQKQWIVDPKGSGRYPGGGLREMDFVNWPTTLYNTRIHPLAPFAMRGVIWHQGEGGPTDEYDTRLIAMFEQWRELFGQDFYCLWGTLARTTSSNPPLEPIRDDFYRSKTNINIRKATELADGKMDFVEFYDLGYSYTHWLQKAESGRRMALAALDLAYDQNHIYTGPRMADIKAEGGVVYVKFDHVGERLSYEPSINGSSGVVLISSDLQARWAKVEVINTDTIKLSHPEIKEVAEISYAIYPNPIETLFNSAGLPASPFQETFKDVSQYRDPAPVQAIVEVLDGSEVGLNLGHVRRDGYSFDLQSRAPSDVRIRAYIPAEWPDFTVQHQGEAVPFEAIEEGGQQYIIFTAKSDAIPYAVTMKDSAAKFVPIHRF